MADVDALSSFDFGKVMPAGKFVKFESGKPLTIRVLTTDPVVYQSVYEDKESGETTIDTKFAFIIYNFTDKKAQILRATPSMAKRIADFGKDPDFGADIKSIDLKISPTGEKLMRRYDIQVLPKANTLTAEQIKECRKINLDAEFEGEGGNRMSLYDQADYNAKHVGEPEDDGSVEDLLAQQNEPVDLDSIPF